MECSLQAVVLIPKGNREFRGIGILGVIWKEVSGVLHFQIGVAVNFHNTLHGFRAVIVTGTASLEVKILHQLA